MLRHDEYGAETLLNLLLRNYLADNLYDQARRGALPSSASILLLPLPLPSPAPICYMSTNVQRHVLPGMLPPVRERPSLPHTALNAEIAQSRACLSSKAGGMRQRGPRKV